MNGRILADDLAGGESWMVEERKSGAQMPDPPFREHNPSLRKNLRNGRDGADLT
jgi:hypothetical protein